MYGRHPTPVTLNRGLPCLKDVYNVARQGLLHRPCRLPSVNPVRGIRFLNGQDIRDRVLTSGEFQRMVKSLPDYLKPVLVCVDALTAMTITGPKAMARLHAL
jgi:hypothetical protein